MNKRIVSLAVGIFVAAAALVTMNVMRTDVEAADGRDCTANSIINCGAYSAGEMQQKYQQNAKGDLPAIYAHYGIDMNQVGAAKQGLVYKDGRVEVDGRTVATGAHSIGRSQISGSSPINIGGKTYYNSANQTAFRSNSIRAFVFLKPDGSFQAAVLMSCGNPVSATPTPPPTPPKPPKNPEAACVKLEKVSLTRTSFRFTASASTKDGATISGYTFNFGDGKSVKQSASSIEHTYIEPGDYTAKVTVHTSVGDKTTTACAVEVKVSPPPVKPEYACESLKAQRIGTEPTDRSYKFTLAYTEKDATLTKVTIDFGDGTSQVYDKAQLGNITHTFSRTGNFTSVATLEFQLKTTPVETKSTTCKVSISIDTPPVPNIQVCRPGEGVITIPENEKRSTDLPANSPECQPTPQVLPTTGPAEQVTVALGLGSVSAAAYYYAASRRGLMSALLGL